MNKNTEVKELTLGQRIKAQRIRLGMTQDELAENDQREPFFIGSPYGEREKK